MVMMTMLARLIHLSQIPWRVHSEILVDSNSIPLGWGLLRCMQICRTV